MRIEYRYEHTVTEDFSSLSAELDRELAEKNGPLQAVYGRYNKLEGIKDIVLCYVDGKPAGCASMKRWSEDTYEVKRVFVRAEYRRKGISEDLMESIERIARGKGIRYLILETGKDFVPAVCLYRKLSYEVIENYGQYAGMAKSICMKKELY